jgi:hypothetical protein
MRFYSMKAFENNVLKTVFSIGDFYIDKMKDNKYLLSCGELQLDIFKNLEHALTNLEERLNEKYDILTIGD